MEVILWRIFIITTLLGVCIMMIQENPERYNRYIVERMANSMKKNKVR